MFLALLFADVLLPSHFHKYAKECANMSVNSQLSMCTYIMLGVAIIFFVLFVRILYVGYGFSNTHRSTEVKKKMKNTN